DWEFPEILVPDIRDKPTILTLATMSSNAYVLPGDIDWRNVTYGDNNPDSNNGDYNTSFGVGWEKPGVRGHVFLSDDNSTVILALKGTSAAVFDSGSETTPLDKLNDNLLFSCCCGRVSYLWTPVCDCYQGSAYRCDGECIERELIRNDRYYKATLNIYRDLARIYPHQNIWVTGHSLGGALAALLARTYAIPAVSFEAPGDLLAAKRLHLPFPPGIAPGEEYIWQFGHTADPIFMGVCNGVGSSCSLGGYAMETACHSGLNCVYDVVSDKGWHVNMLNHRIHTVIDEVLMDYDQPASCVNPGPCVDCFNWRFDKKESKESSKASSKTSSTVSLESPT
ncbi:alpha/beta-hydrolase, partial [Nadsonia fulvescens var. elongata DSM 6958]